MMRAWAVWLLDWWRGLPGKERAPVVLEGLGIVVVAIYTAINFCLYHTTKDSLRISQRAYLNVGPIGLDSSSGTILLPLENSGHLPAMNPMLFGAEVRAHWPDGKQIEFNPINISSVDTHVPPGKGYLSYTVTMNNWSNGDLTAIKNKEETVFVVLTLSYGDGFGNLVTDYSYCTETLYYGNDMHWVGCLPGTMSAFIDRAKAEIAVRACKCTPQPSANTQPNAQPNAHASAGVPIAFP